METGDFLKASPPIEMTSHAKLEEILIQAAAKIGSKPDGPQVILYVPCLATVEPDVTTIGETVEKL
ncbi:hypothetical protein, partial [Streptomyces sp. GbtcB6]|uniref:hypothetical protein n=1 Tax=Streptomyces sp. GbtcB6 TaxID=2824751 RepID=UPI001C2FFE9F